MMMPRKQIVVVTALACVLFLTACGQTSPVRNARQELAAEYSQGAQRAFRRGDYLVALRQYEMALHMDVTVENIPGIAIDMLNLARVHQELGNLEIAHSYLDKLLQEDALQYEALNLATAATQKALLLLQQGNVHDVRTWLDKAEEWCGAKCQLLSAIDNARAALALQERDAGGALHWSERAASNSRGKDSLEHANALRYMAEAKLLQGEFVQAARLASETLVLDKTLGLPEKIRQDLLLAERAYEGQGDASQAARFRERASRIIAR